MTDDLPARLERSAELEKLIKVTDENTRDISAWFNRLAVDARKAAARIRELEAELELYKSAGITREELDGLHFATHVIVPVEPTEFMEDVVFDIFDANEPSMGDIYRAMIRAAQPERQQGE